MIVVFYSQKDGQKLATVRLVDGGLVPEPAVANVVRAWRGTAQEFMDYYSDYQNGYIYSQEKR